jgi:hypothetical protein
MIRTSAGSKSRRFRVTIGSSRDSAMAAIRLSLTDIGFAAAAKVGEQLSPAQPDVRLPREAVNPADRRVEPAFQSGSLGTARKQQDAEASLAQNHRVDRDLALVFATRRSAGWVWAWSPGEDVGVDQQGHSVSVDSESIATKYPFSGQASSQSCQGRTCRRMKRSNNGTANEYLPKRFL